MRIFSYERKLKEMPKMIIITTQNNSLSRINNHGDRTILRQSRDGQMLGNGMQLGFGSRLGFGSESEYVVTCAVTEYGVTFKCDSMNN